MGLNNPGGIKGAVKPVICCPVVNGGFETGDFTGWITDVDYSSMDRM